MVNVNTSYGSAPAIYSMLDSSKGSFGNRVDCTVHRAANNIRCGIETAAVGAAGIAGYNVINKATKMKSFKWNNDVNNALKKGAELYKKLLKDFGKSTSSLTGVKKFLANGVKGIIDLMKTGCEKLSKTSGRQKLLGLLGIGILGALVAVQRKQAYKDGQYEERYTTRAKVMKA